MKKILTLAICAVLWFAALCLFAFSGSFHPACYAYAGTFIPLAYAFIYLYAASKMKSFGVPTILNGFLLVLLLASGEADTIMVISIVVLTALAEVLRKVYGYDTRKGTRISFIPLALTFFCYKYHIIGVVGYSNSRSTTIGEGVVQTVYVSNGKVTSIVNH